METFKTYFMGLAVHEREDFAARCSTSRQHLTNIAYGKTCGESLAISIERESSGAVRCEDLRPDVDWAYLRGTDKASTTSEAPAECASGDPRRGIERRRPDQRAGERRKED